jgi:DNA-binding MarR family transcriptional regulator
MKSRRSQGQRAYAPAALVLQAIVENEGLSQTGIVDRTGVDRSTIAEMAVRMQRKGWLQRRRTKADARAYALNLTDEGRRVLRVAEPQSRAVDHRVLDAIPAGRREQFIDEVQAIGAELEAMAPPPAPSKRLSRRSRIPAT